MPLARKRILVTRTRGQSSELAALLEDRGAVPLLVPTIEIVPPESFDSLDTALAQLESFDWLVFTSANAVEAFTARLGTNLGAPFMVAAATFIAHEWDPRIAVVGPATAKAVQAAGLKVDLIPPRYVAESLAESLAPEAAGKRVLLVRAAVARDILPDELKRAGASVTIAEAYRNRIPEESIPALQELFASPKNLPDAITFTSSSTARNLVALLDAANLILPPSVALASIGPITSQSMRDLGLTPDIEALESTIPALVEALDEKL
ncbi:MAG: uroporphyrinogen-III synthase [Acidobacteriaceae bacterium]|nr:uroporphyrinogen-III synthase [Acidobacteriaceae bacterium]